jgi:hypothetical protein
MPFGKTLLKSLWHRSSPDDGSRNTINVGSVYYFDFDQTQLQSRHIGEFPIFPKPIIFFKIPNKLTTQYSCLQNDSRLCKS